MSFVTFIVPSATGRIELERALESLLLQTDPDWEAVVVCDGWERTYEGPVPHDPRIRWVGCDVRSAGRARNIGITQANPYSEYVAFLDDDDALHPKYVEWLRERAYADPGDPDPARLVIFPMQYEDGMVIPAPDNQTIAWGNVGISFAVRRDVMRRHRFIREDLDNPGRNGNEDICLVADIMDEGVVPAIMPTVAYYVGHDPNERTSE